MTLLTILSLPRLFLLMGYVVLVAHGCGWWGVPLLCVFVLGLGCTPPTVHLTQVKR
jgi:hypothetical protein